MKEMQACAKPGFHGCPGKVQQMPRAFATTTSAVGS